LQTDDADDADRGYADLEQAQEFVDSLLERATRTYNRIFTCLWSANGAAAGLSSTAMWHDNALRRGLLFPLAFFMLGLLALVVGDLCSLRHEVKIIRRAEEAPSLLQMPGYVFRRPSEQAGLTPRDWRLKMGSASGILFILGLLTMFIAAIA
jgi:hypothetical protein